MIFTDQQMILFVGVAIFFLGIFAGYVLKERWLAIITSLLLMVVGIYYLSMVQNPEADLLNMALGCALIGIAGYTELKLIIAEIPDLN